MNTSFLIAAPSSGSGKTTIARGLMALYARKGWRVQPFKCGPDYIDTKFHASVCGHTSINLDTFMASNAHVSELYNYYAHKADVCIVEGMMGLFDGYDHDHGSSAEIARVLDIPIVLVVDARSAAYSMAALLQGFLNFRPDLTFAGVIFNRVGSERHAAMLREVAAEVGIECFACLPKSAALEHTSRYLGLDFSEVAETDELVQLLEKNIDLEMLSKIRPRSYGDKTTALSIEDCGLMDLRPQPFPHVHRHDADATILVARNAESFSFIYEETLDYLRKCGTIRFFDPESDVPDFSNIDLLYLPGGYPEKHVEMLVNNETCRNAIREYADRGGRILAECGGMMYLCQSIVDDEGEHPMCGVFSHSISARKADRRLSLGYRRFELDGHVFRGHEFHYTQFMNPVPVSTVEVVNARGETVSTAVLQKDNVWASYTHLSPMDIGFLSSRCWL